MSGFDPLENAKRGNRRGPAATPPAPASGEVPRSEPIPVAEDPALEKVRHAREGTPVYYPPAVPVQVPPPPAPAAEVPEEKFLVTKTQIICVGGLLTTLAKGSVVSERSHDLENLRAQNVKMEPIANG